MLALKPSLVKGRLRRKSFAGVADGFSMPLLEGVFFSLYCRPALAVSSLKDLNSLPESSRIPVAMVCLCRDCGPLQQSPGSEWYH